MKELQQKLTDLKKKLAELGGYLKLQEKQEEVAALEKQQSEPGFWDNNEKARMVSQKIAELKKLLDQYERLVTGTNDALGLVEEALQDSEVSLEEELSTQYDALMRTYEALELVVFMTGKYDTAPVIMTIHAGAGGHDAQDWAEMIMSMYTRFAEKSDWSVDLIHVSRGEEAGIKSAMLEIKGAYAYGYLKRETGVHRLVRISPFDAAKARHTSFAYVEILPEIEHTDIEIDENDIRIDTFLSGGPGGQSVQTTYSAVRMVHTPTGITVSVQSERSQLANKERALKILASRLQQYEEAEREEERLRLRGELTENAWGSQIRSYVLHPYKMVKDHRTNYEESDAEGVLNGKLGKFIDQAIRNIPV